MRSTVFKSRVRIVKDETVVKKWIEDQSWKTEYICLNLPEPLRLATMEEVEKHFRQTHLADIIKPVESHTLVGDAARSLRSPELARLVREIGVPKKRIPPLRKPLDLPVLPCADSSAQHDREVPEVGILSNIIENGRYIGIPDAGQDWHTDMTYRQVPGFVNVLYGIRIRHRDGKPLGGTEFSNMHLAYEALPSSATYWDRKFADSPLEESGFEPSVPPRKWGSFRSHIRFVRFRTGIKPPPNLL